MSGVRNCVSSSQNNYPSAPSRVRKDPRIERCTTGEFDTDSWSRKEIQRGWNGAVRPERDIYQNPKQEVRKYPVHLLIDSIRKENDIDTFTTNGLITFNLTDTANNGVSSELPLRNIQHVELSHEIRIPYVDNQDFYQYDRFSLEITTMGSKYDFRDITGSGNNTPFHFWLNYEFDDPDDPNFIILKPQLHCMYLIPQGTKPETIGFRLRTPFIDYTFPVDRVRGIITAAGPPLTITLTNGQTHNLVVGDRVAFINPQTGVITLDNSLSNRAGIPVAGVPTNDTFTLALDGTGAVGQGVDLYIVKNRILFPISLEGLR